MLRFEDLSERARDWLMVIPAGGIYFGSQTFMQEERAFLVALSFGAFYVVISREWDKRHERWFWALIAAFGLLHVTLLSIMKLPHFTGPSLGIAAPFLFVDGFGMWGTVKFVQKRLSQTRA